MCCDHSYKGKQGIVSTPRSPLYVCILYCIGYFIKRISGSNIVLAQTRFNDVAN